MPGFPFLSFVSYAVFGIPGLVLLNPAITISLIFVSERISTKLFGKYVGLLTLLFLATSNLIFRNSLRLQSDIVFSVFILFLVAFLAPNNFLRILDKSPFSLGLTINLTTLIPFLTLPLL